MARLFDNVFTNTYLVKFMHTFIDYHEEVAAAIGNNKPVVALESTVIAHGLPYPHNLKTALAMEDIIRSCGAIPATICIKHQKIAVGLGRCELETLAKNGPRVKKVGTRDLSYALSQGLLGATTVSSTMYCAKMAGIKVFATGGIGGVHRDGHVSFDISADVMELAQTKVAVVCAGVKSILDIGRTLEMLETLRVPVIGFRTNDFPAFYSRNSGYRLDMQLDSAYEIAQLIDTHFAVADSGLVIANAIDEAQEIARARVDAWVTASLNKAHTEGIRGHEVTPYLLKELFSLSDGQTLKANIALLESNAKLAAEIAVSLSNLVTPWQSPQAPRTVTALDPADYAAG